MSHAAFSPRLELSGHVRGCCYDFVTFLLQNHVPEGFRVWIMVQVNASFSNLDDFVQFVVEGGRFSKISSEIDKTHQNQLIWTHKRVV